MAQDGSEDAGGPAASPCAALSRLYRFSGVSAI